MKTYYIDGKEASREEFLSALNTRTYTLTEDTDTEEKLISGNPEREIRELKQKLTATDYQAIKYAEGQLTESEYTEMKAQRQSWREEINRLEAELAGEVKG